MSKNLQKIARIKAENDPIKAVYFSMDVKETLTENAKEKETILNQVRSAQKVTILRRTIEKLSFMLSKNDKIPLFYSVITIIA